MESIVVISDESEDENVEIQLVDNASELLTERTSENDDIRGPFEEGKRDQTKSEIDIDTSYGRSFDGSSSPLSNLLKHSKKSFTNFGDNVKGPNVNDIKEDRSENDILTIDSSDAELKDKFEDKFEDKIGDDLEDNSDEAVDFRVTDLSQRKPEIISLDDTLEESDFSFTVHEPIQKKPKIDKTSHQEKMKQINQQYGAAQLKEANKVSRKKEELLAEMMMSVPDFVYERFLKEGLLQESDFPQTKVEVNKNQIPVINWRRKVTAKYNQENDIFLPCPATEIHETCRVLYYQAEEFFNKLTMVDLDNETEVLRTIPFQTDTIIMVEGYNQQLTKINNLENKLYKQRVLDKNQTIKELKYTVKDIEYLINKLQFKYVINIYPVKNLMDARDWLFSFTYTMAFGLYDKLERNTELANLTNIKSGSDYKSTFIETIHKFKLMPYTRCERLFLYYDTLQKISTRYKTNNTLGKDKHGKNLVAESTEIGMKNFFNSTDPNEIVYS